MRILCAIPLVLMLGLAPAVIGVQAQSTPLPQVYSLTVSAGMTTINVARDGSKVSLEQIVPKSDRGTGMHIRQIYDFATHQYWTMPEGEPCIVSTYTSSYLPSMFDPIGGAEEMRAEIAKSKPVALRSETVNGIATKVYEIPVPEIKGKMRMFLEEKHHFVVKAVIIPAGGKEQTQMEITSRRTRSRQQRCWCRRRTAGCRLARAARAAGTQRRRSMRRRKAKRIWAPRSLRRRAARRRHRRSRWPAPVYLL